MKGSTFGTEPFIQTDSEKQNVIGGAALDIFDTFAKYYKIEYTIKLATDWYELDKVGSLIGGAGGDVSTKIMF